MLKYPGKRTKVPKQKVTFYSAAENTMFIDNGKHDTSVKTVAAGKLVKLIFLHLLQT